jgi:hypothetical protein
MNSSVNSSSSEGVVMLARLEIQLSLWSSLLTDLHLKFSILNKVGARSLGAAP